MAQDKVCYGSCDQGFYKSKMMYVRSEVFTAVTMKNGVFWDVTPRGSCKNSLGISSQFVSVASYS
jgi:hypothetical protein